MKNFKSINWLLFCIFVLILFECGLFCLGRLFVSERRTSVPGSVSIACAGDSHTFGVGTSARYSYPQQVAALLNANNKSPKFTIVNLGIPGSSTKRQVRELQLYLRHNHADIVILLTGRNNEILVRQFGKMSFRAKFYYCLRNLKSLRFLKAICGYIPGIGAKVDRDALPVFGQRYADYLNFYLEKARRLCLDNGSKLVLLSYYNSSDAVIEEFARRYSIPFVDLTRDFEMLFRAAGRQKYISPDMSHLNHLGYQFFAEHLYDRLFQRRAYLGVNMDPLPRRRGENDFYSNDAETESMIELQKERMSKMEDSSEYPFELIHLGHIYTEAGYSEAARECYLQALRRSGYSDNNTVTSPIINSYLRKGMKDEAIKICEEILSRNPANYIAKFYLDQLSPR